VVLTGAVGDGATPKSLPVEGLKKLEAWLKTVQPPKYPFEIDWGLALGEGRKVFLKHCADCHGDGGKKIGTVIPWDEIKTDRHRLEMWSPGGESKAAQIYNQKYADYPWGFKRFTKTSGYVAVPLVGLWLRAPYLHNGSVPTLEDLLEPQAKRPKVFYRGYDVYGRKRTGFVHREEEILKEDPVLQQSDNPKELLDKIYFRYDTDVAGNSNAGHDGAIYGTELAPEEKRALVEYLKTL
jgi:hypothetical protein